MCDFCFIAFCLYLDLEEEINQFRLISLCRCITLVWICFLVWPTLKTSHIIPWRCDGKRLVSAGDNKGVLGTLQVKKKRSCDWNQDKYHSYLPDDAFKEQMQTQENQTRSYLRTAELVWTYLFVSCLLSVVSSSVCAGSVLLGKQLPNTGRFVSSWLFGVLVKFPAITTRFVVEICETNRLSFKSLVFMSLIEENQSNESSPEPLAASSHLLLLRPLVPSCCASQSNAPWSSASTFSFCSQTVAFSWCLSSSLGCPRKSAHLGCLLNHRSPHFPRGILYSLHGLCPDGTPWV